MDSGPIQSTELLQQNGIYLHWKEAVELTFHRGARHALPSVIFAQKRPLLSGERTEVDANEDGLSYLIHGNYTPQWH